MISVELEVRTVSTLNMREHWATRARRASKHRRAARHAVFEATRGRGIALWPHGAQVMLTRVSAGEMDDDNVRGALKAIRDGVADALGIDDRDPRVRWQYHQAKGKRGQHRVRIEITKQEPTK